MNVEINLMSLLTIKSFLNSSSLIGSKYVVKNLFLIYKDSDQNFEPIPSFVRNLVAKL